jgi:phosphoribosylformimino-5-aminoimidazole carboxamide ribotide isomerase
MNLIPAIDLLGGACVRLTRGSYDRVERYGKAPLEVALRFQAAGARWIHLVDLDAARTAAAPLLPGAALADGNPERLPVSSATVDSNDQTAQPKAANNRPTIRLIARAVSCSIEVGGGIRSYLDVEELLKAGAERLIIGTTLVKNPEEVSRWCALHPGTLWAGIDADRGAVKISGWESGTDLQDVELAGRVRQMGLAGIVYTSIGRDGTLEGPDMERTNRIAEVSGLPVILSGGIGSMEHVRQVARRRHPGVEGLIIGKAIYQGRVDVAELFRAVE